MRLVGVKQDAKKQIDGINLQLKNATSEKKKKKKKKRVHENF